MANYPPEEEIMALVSERESMRQARRFSDSDAIRETLKKMGVELYDKERQWKCKDGRRGDLFTAGGGACLLTDANVHEFIQKREDARTAKEWDKADTIRLTLRSQGVELDDRERKWRTAGGRSGTYSGESKSSAALLTEAEIKALVAERERARDKKDFQTADELRRRLLRLGVELFDNERTWKTNDGRQGVIITGGSGNEILRCSLADAEIMMHIQRREDARTQKVEEYPAMASSKVTTGARLSDDDGLWAGEGGRTAAPATATEPWRHASRAQCSADPPRFDVGYNQAPRAAERMEGADPPPSSRLLDAAGCSFTDGCRRQSSTDDRVGDLPRGNDWDSWRGPPDRGRPEAEPCGSEISAPRGGTRCGSYASEFDASSHLGIPPPLHIGVPSSLRPQLDARHSGAAPTRYFSPASASGSEGCGAGNFGVLPAASSHQPSPASVQEHRLASAAPYARACAHQSIGTTMPPPGAAAARDSQSAEEAERARARQAWDEGSVLEIFSSTSRCWHVARLVEVREEGCQDVLTARFYMEDEPKQKSLYRHDAQLAPLGAHTSGELPPGFTVRPSQSRPGQLVYLDATTGTKYGSSDLAWCVHFDRIGQQPAAGLHTVCAMPKQKPVSSGTALTPARAAASPSGAALSDGSPPGSRAISLAELCSRGPGQGASPSRPAALAVAEGAPSATGVPRVALPAFGGASDSQSAYLGYVGALGLKDAAATPASERPRPAWQPPRAHYGPAARTWQEDAFSQWRGQ